MLPNIFENAKVGDLVFWVKIGWGTIKEIRSEFMYPISVSFELDTNEEFMLDGRCSVTDKLPTLFPENTVPQYYLDLCPRPKRKVKKTLEVWANIYPYSKFSVYTSEELANKRACSGRITCAKLTGEYEIAE